MGGHNLTPDMSGMATIQGKSMFGGQPNLCVLVGGVGWTLPCVCIGMQLTLLYPKIYRIHAFCF